jgi:chromosome segregation ATPase
MELEMSETPQSTVTRWLDHPQRLVHREVRDAIRAVLELLAISNADREWLLRKADTDEAERDTLRARVESLLHRMTSEEAATEIERLRAEVERAERDRANLTVMCNEETEWRNIAQREVERLRAELTKREEAHRGTIAMREELRDEVAGLVKERDQSEADYKLARAEVERLRYIISPGAAEVYEERMAALQARAEKAEAALRDLDYDERGDVTGWPNQLRVMEILRDTAPREGFFARGEDGQYHPDPAPLRKEE